MVRNFFTEVEGEPQGDEFAVWYSKSDLPETGRQLSNEERKVTFNKTYLNSNRRSPPPAGRAESRPGRGSVPLCHWCGRRGHSEEFCWAKTGACLICGGKDHQRADCPQYGSMPGGGFKPTCSCGGPHLGKDCSSSN